ncbi:hypothetical protein GDO81_011899 [Engystomops pustulosus]|uniref:Secreted protein n=1 Tax=Engystomops pustulosus TaxID=76066 RepID=A0AAV7BHJ3_ENGPU|nr:hypothetical protein GDO81_011899 [Engystomops pustulosus]
MFFSHVLKFVLLMHPFAWMDTDTGSTLCSVTSVYGCMRLTRLRLVSMAIHSRLRVTISRVKIAATT